MPYHTISISSYQTPQLLFSLLHVSVWLLFKGGYYFFRKPADVNDGWIRNVQAIQWRLLDDVNSKQSQSVLLSAMEMSCTTQTALVLAQWLSSKIVHIHICCIIATATIWAHCSFRSEPPIVWLHVLSEDSVYSKEYRTNNLHCAWRLCIVIQWLIDDQL